MSRKRREINESPAGPRERALRPATGFVDSVVEAGAAGGAAGGGRRRSPCAERSGPEEPCNSPPSFSRSENLLGLPGNFFFLDTGEAEATSCGGCLPLEVTHAGDPKRG